MSLCATLLAVTLFVPAPQSAKPDFSGKWTLDAAKSDFGGQPGPSTRVDEITQKGTSLRVKRTIGMPDGASRTLDITYDLTGKETTQQAPPMKLTAGWKGASLVTVGKGEAQGGIPVTVTDTWTLSPDRKTLTVHRDLVTSEMSATQVFVLKRT